MGDNLPVAVEKWYYTDLTKDNTTREIWVSYTKCLQEVIVMLDDNYKVLNQIFGVTSAWTIEASEWNQVQASLEQLFLTFYALIKDCGSFSVSRDLEQCEAAVQELQPLVKAVEQRVQVLAQHWEKWKGFGSLTQDCVIQPCESSLTSTFFENAPPDRKDTSIVEYFTWKNQAWGFFVVLSSFNGYGCFSFCRSHVFSCFVNRFSYYVKTTKKSPADLITSSLQQVYSDLDALYFAERKQHDNSGAAMVMVLYNLESKELYSSNVGDCETIVVSNNRGTRLLSTRHMVKHLSTGGSDAKRVYSNSDDVDVFGTFLAARNMDVLHVSHILGCYPFKSHGRTGQYAYSKEVSRPMSPHASCVVPFPARKTHNTRKEKTKKFILCASLPDYSDKTIDDETYYLFSRLTSLNRSRLEVDV
jgi:serine/threonine protein phosphatase PrpC